MRSALAILLLAATVHAAPRPEAVRALAGSCTTTPVNGCDTDTFGALESGDCLLEGARYDVYSFNGVAGTIVEVMVRPLDESYPQPYVLLVAPAGDVVSEPPGVGGGSGGATVWYQLPTSGTWRIAVGSDDVFASGRYVLHLYCYSDNDPSPPGCIPQYLLCGQSAVWNLNADSCRFQGTSKAFARWSIYAVAGDTLRFTQSSFDFQPLFGIYREGQLLESSEVESSFEAAMTYRVRETGWYEFLTTSVEEGRGGEFDVLLECQGSGCTWPFPLAVPPPVTAVPHGTPATLPFSVNAVGGFQTKLTENGVAVTASTNAVSSIATPPVTIAHRYALEFENACGTWVTDEFSVTPQCSALTIVSAPDSLIRANRGDVVNLTVVAQGTSPRVTWYAGTPPDNSKIAASGPTFSTVVSGSATYWYRVADACGQTFTSPSIHISVEGSRRRAVRH